MKIAFLSCLFGPLSGGGEVSTKRLFDELKKQGQDVIILSTRRQPSNSEIIVLAPLDNVPTKLLIPGNPMTDYLLAELIKEELEVLQPDIIHVHDHFTLNSAVMANKKLKLPLVYTCRNNVNSHYYRQLSCHDRLIMSMFEIRDRVVLKALRQVDAIIAISNYIEEELKRSGADSNKVVTIYNIPPLVSIATKTSYRTAGLEIICFAAGRLIAEKGFDVAINAINIANAKFRGKLKLVIAGNGPQIGELQRMVDLMGLQSLITFTGWVSQKELLNFYEHADIFLMPSVYPEPFGRETIEAMSFGKPIIASNTGGIPEAVLDGVNGFLIPANDPYKMAEAILTLANDMSLRTKLGATGMKRVNEIFNPQKLAGQTIQLYERLIAQRP